MNLPSLCFSGKVCLSPVLEGPYALFLSIAYLYVQWIRAILEVLCSNLCLWCELHWVSQLESFGFWNLSIIYLAQFENFHYWLAQCETESHHIILRARLAANSWSSYGSFMSPGVTCLLWCLDCHLFIENVCFFLFAMHIFSSWWDPIWSSLVSHSLSLLAPLTRQFQMTCLSVAFSFLCTTKFAAVPLKWKFSLVTLVSSSAWGTRFRISSVVCDFVFAASSYAQRVPLCCYSEFSAIHFRRFTLLFLYSQALAAWSCPPVSLCPL